MCSLITKWLWVDVRAGEKKEKKLSLCFKSPAGKSRIIISTEGVFGYKTLLNYMDVPLSGLIWPCLSTSALAHGMHSHLINLQILFWIKCLQKDNCDFINSFVGSRWRSASLPRWISDDAVVLWAHYCGNP